MVRIILFAALSALVISCGNSNSCPENCIQLTGFVKDSFTGAPAVNLPFEVYWVKHKTVTKVDMIDTGMTDLQGRINKTIEIDRDRFETHWIFVRLLPNKRYRQISGTYITEAIQEYTPSKDLNFTVHEMKE